MKTWMAMILFLCSGQTVAFGAACETIDQGCEALIGPTLGQRMECGEEDPWFCLAQSFTPQMSFVCGVELLLFTRHGDVSVAIQSSLVPGEGVIAVAEASLTPQQYQWVRFNLSAELTPGAQYFILPYSDSNNLWFTETMREEGNCEYGGGSAYRGGEEEPYDFLFRVYGDEPTPITTETWGSVKSIFQ